MTTETIKMVSKKVALSLAHANCLLVEHDCSGKAWESDLKTAAVMASGEVFKTAAGHTMVFFQGLLLKNSAMLTAQLRAFGYKVELK